MSDWPGSAEKTARSLKWLLIAYALILLAAVSIRPLWVDEVVQLLITTSSSVSSMIRSIPINPGATPLGYLTQHPFVRAFGLSAFSESLSVNCFQSDLLLVAGPSLSDSATTASGRNASDWDIHVFADSIPLCSGSTPLCRGALLQHFVCSRPYCFSPGPSTCLGRRLRPVTCRSGVHATIRHAAGMRNQPLDDYDASTGETMEERFR